MTTLTQDANHRHRQLVGRNIVRARGEAEISQNRLATLLGIDRRHVSRWETGVWLPNAAHLESIAEALGQPLAYFVTDHDEE